MKSSCAEKLRHMRHASMWRRSACSSAGSSSRSQASDSSREARRQLMLASSAMGPAPAEPVALEAGAKREARAMHDHPAVGGGDSFVVADGRGVVAQHLAAEEHSP